MFKRLVLTLSLVTALTGLATAADKAIDIKSVATPFTVTLSSRGITFCDYFLITQNAILVAGQHVLSNCGLPDALVSGNFNLGFGTAPYLSTPAHGFNLNSTANCPASLFYLFNTDAGTWANYAFDGSVLIQLHTGTYAIGAGAAAPAIAGGQSSTVK